MAADRDSDSAFASETIGFVPQRRELLGAKLLAVFGKVEREGQVVHVLGLMRNAPLVHHHSQAQAGDKLAL